MTVARVASVRVTVARVAAALFALASCRGAWAQPAAELDASSPWALLGQALLSLAVVIGLIYLVYFGLRKLNDRQLGAEAEGPMRVAQARHLGGDRWLYLVEVEGRRLLVGGTGAGLALIAELEPGATGPSGGARCDEA